MQWGGDGQPGLDHVGDWSGPLKVLQCPQAAAAASDGSVLSGRDEAKSDSKLQFKASVTADPTSGSSTSSYCASFFPPRLARCHRGHRRERKLAAYI